MTTEPTCTAILVDQTRMPASVVSRRRRGTVLSGIFTLFVLPAIVLGVVAPTGWRVVTAAEFGPTDISGVAYNDRNNNGIQDNPSGVVPTSEPGVNDIRVRAYDAAGAIAAQTTTDASGAYTLRGLVAGAVYRVNFENLPAGAQPALHGASSSVDLPASGSSVQFVSAGARNVSFGMHWPCDYCQKDPFVIANYYMNGDPLQNGSAANGFSLVAFPYAASGSQRDNRILVRGAQMGATSGLAYQRATDTVFAAAVLKRHVGLGALGLGGIYSIGVAYGDSIPNGITMTRITPWLDVSTFGVDLGQSPRQAGALPSGHNTANRDIGVFEAVGKIGMGDLEISDDDQTLWFINLYQRELIEMRVGAPARRPAAGDIIHHPLPRVECPRGEFRPWATKFYRNALYVGGVCSGEYVGAQASDLTAHVFAHDVDGTVGSFRPVITFPLNYPRTYVSPGHSARWQPWLRDWYDINPLKDGGAYLQTIHPQPILLDLEFADDGAMIIGMFDRLAHQGGAQNHGTRVSDPDYYDVASGGDLLKACLVQGAYVLESNAACGGRPAMAGANTGAGPGGGEFFYGDFWSVSHSEVMLGGLALLPGRGEVISTGYDTLQHGRSTGLSWMNTHTGEKVRGYEVTGPDYLGRSVTMGKASGLGDVELMCDPSPTEIGNRVWRDDNGDGLQGAGEPGLGGVRVQLLSASRVLSTTTTAGDGSYFFNLSAIDAALGAQAGHSVTVRLALDDPQLPLGYVVTPQNAGGRIDNDEATDHLDSDADNELRATGSRGAVTQVSYTTRGAGMSNHTLDFGFRPQAGLGDYVWLDLDADGRQTSNEPALPGITATLFLDGRIVSTTVTTSSGYYQFVNLTPGVPYHVCFAQPGGMPWTVPGSDPHGADDSNARPDGCAPPVILTPLEFNPTIDAGLILPLKLIKRARSTGNLGTLGPDGTITFTLTISNPWPWPVRDVTVSDPLSSKLTYVPGSAVPAPVLLNPLTWRYAEVAAHSMHTITFVSVATLTNTLVITNVGYLKQGDTPITIDQVSVPNNPTAIGLARFTVEPAEAGMRLLWSTSFERNTLGYALYREDGAQLLTRINIDLVPARATSGALYVFTDSAGNTNSRYWLEEVELGGATHRYGPVQFGACDRCVAMHTFKPMLYLPLVASPQR